MRGVGEVKEGNGLVENKTTEMNYVRSLVMFEGLGVHMIGELFLAVERRDVDAFLVRVLHCC